MDKEILLANMDRIHSTSLGILRIKRNLQLETEDIIHYCKRKIKKIVIFIKKERIGIVK